MKGTQLFRDLKPIAKLLKIKFSFCAHIMLKVSLLCQHYAHFGMLQIITGPSQTEMHTFCLKLTVKTQEPTTNAYIYCINLHVALNT